MIRGAEPFLYSGGSRGVLLVHGFTGSPAEMRLLGKHLHEQGYTVFAPRLCGHGTCPEDLSETSWQHWYSDVEDGYQLLNSMCSEVNVIGQSMGGLLSFLLATEYAVKRIVSLSTPIYIADRRLPLLPLYSFFQSYVPKRRRRYSDLAREYAIGYELTPLKSLSSLIDLIRHVDYLLSRIKQPVLVIQSKAEHTVRPESAQYIYDSVGTKVKKLVWLERSGHVLTLDQDRQKVFEEIDHWLLEV